MTLAVDREQLSAFVYALFCYAGNGAFVSLRTFRDQKEGAPVSIKAVELRDNEIRSLVDAAEVEATRAANFIEPAVFCPPLAAFKTSSSAREQDLAEAFALSVECDQRPTEARVELESLLGPATIIVASGGEWLNPETGEIQRKLHLHWRLNEAAAGDSLSILKEARRLATSLVGGDPTNVPMVHPIRWAGSWHRKGEPRLVQIVELNCDAEIELSDALEKLREAAPPQAGITLSARGDASAANDDRALSDLVRGVVSGDSLHPNLVPLAARMVGSGMVGGAVVNTLRGLMDASSAPRDERWQARYADLPRTVRTAEEKFKLVEPEITRPAGDTLPLIDPADWGDRLPPVRQWAWAGWIPARQATYLTGAGSAGKSLFAQQLASHVALGRAFLGVNTTPGSALYVTCEDDGDELHRRQDAICEALDAPFSAFGGRLKLVSLTGEPGNELATFDPQNRMVTTAAWARLRRTVLELRPSFVALDNVAHLFAGNENIRVHVAAFVSLLNGLAAEAETSILFIGHPNKAGQDFSGSTAWENQVRSRLFLGIPDSGRGSRGAGENPSEADCGLAGVVDPDCRVLTRAKANYAKRGEELKFRWWRWAFIQDEDLPAGEADNLASHLLAKAQDERFLACLAKTAAERRATSPNPSASNFAPRVFAKMPSGSGIGVAGFEAALQRLLDTGEVLNNQRIYQRDNRAWVTGLGPAPTLAPTMHEAVHEAALSGQEKPL